MSVAQEPAARVAGSSRGIHRSTSPSRDHHLGTDVKRARLTHILDLLETVVLLRARSRAVTPRRLFSASVPCITVTTSLLL